MNPDGVQTVCSKRVMCTKMDDPSKKLCAMRQAVDGAPAFVYNEHNNAHRAWPGTGANSPQRVQCPLRGADTEDTNVTKKKIGVLGAGTWGMALARMLCVSGNDVQDVFSNTCMRVYTNADIKGVELSGALKNVIALGVGISTGLGYGDNARAALITRGIAEIARLGVAMGCNIHTFAGLAGIGDLIVTATSMHSRNNRAGILIGKGKSPEQAVKEVGMVVEGINALPAAMELAAKYNVEMPIVQTVNAIVKEGMSASDALRTLMDRNRKNEMPQGYEKV